MNKVLLLVLAFSAVHFTVTAQTVKKQTTKKATASYYHGMFNGRKTAAGDTYWDHLKTAASNVYNLGTKLLITNLNTGKSVKVVVNDRMAPHIKGRVDLSKSAFQEIASLHHGIVPVHVEVLGARQDEKDNTL